MAKIKIIGLGNLLMGDDGLGIRVIEILERNYQFPKNVEIVEGGTGGLYLLPVLRDAEKVIFVDAVNFSDAPGTVHVFKKEDLFSAGCEKISMHEIGLSDLLSLAGLSGNLPEEIFLVGMVPKKIEFSTSLSKEVERNLPVLMEKIFQILNTWGIQASFKKVP